MGFFVSKYFCRATKIMSGYSPLLKPFKVLSLRNVRSRSVQWLLLNPDRNFWKILSSFKNLFVWSRATFPTILKSDGSEDIGR